MNIYDMSWEEVYAKGSLSKEEYNKLKAELDNSPLREAAWDAITKQNIEVTKYFTKLHYLLIARINYLENQLKEN